MTHSLGNKLNFKMKQTMKKYFIFLASAAMLFATSCAKEEVNTTGETELITVQLNPETKTALGAEGTTTWDADDKVSVTVGGKVVGTLSLVEGSTFSGEITAGLSGEAILNYPAGETAVPASQAAVKGSFADGAALLEGKTTVEKLRAGEGVELQNKTALLQFTVAQAGDVTFEVGTAKYTVTGCQTGSTYYACVAPASNVSFVARIGGYFSKQASKNVTFTANKVANLGSLPAPSTSGAYLKGSFNGWGDGQALYIDLNGWYVIKNFKIENNDTYFKFEKSGAWTGYNGTFYLNNYANTSKGGGDNVKINSGIYDFYFHKDENSIYVTTAGGYAPGVSRPVRLLVNNAGNKSNLRVYMWDSKETPILGEWNSRPSMTKKINLNGTSYTYIELDSKYYDQSLNYKLTWNGGDSGDVKNVYFGQDNYYDLW